MKLYAFEPRPSICAYKDISFFDEHQRHAMYRIVSRIINHTEKEDNTIIKMDAPGGFGKTHMLREVCSILDKASVSSRVATFTGRAASQVAKDGLTNVSTLHALLQEAICDSEGNLLYFEDRVDLEVANSIGDALICDEASMVPRKMFDRMRTVCELHNIVFVVVGDQQQLPSIEPPKSPAFDLLRRTDIPFEQLTLQTNYRQKEGSSIADLCMHLREHNSIPRTKAADLRMVSKSKVNSLEFHDNNKFDVAICGTHKTRKKINALIRRSRGFHDETAQIGETVICKRNDIVANVRINNGELFTVQSVFPSSQIGCHTYLLSGMDAQKTVRVNVPDECWDGVLSQGRKQGGAPIQQFEFGYCITCHSAQGSQFDNLLYIDEDVSYFLPQDRFRYTAVSRARNKLTVAL